MEPSVNIDELIEIVRKGGSVKTGLDVYNSRDVLLIEKNVLINSVNTLLTLKQNGLLEVPVDYGNTGGVWDKNGKYVETKAEPAEHDEPKRKIILSEASKKVRKITQIKKEAKAFHQRAKENVKKIIEEIKKTGGIFNQAIIESTVDDIFDFLATNGNVFSYLAKELFTYDEYLYNHSVNVCTLGAAVLLQFNEHFGELINKHLNQLYMGNTSMNLSENSTSFILYYPDELKEIAMGMFLHDIGKVLVSEQVLNKQGELASDERALLDSHSYELGERILKKNGIQNAFINNVVKFHHSPIFKGETNTYPAVKLPIEVPPYVKICKLVDIYDSLTSKRSYKDAESPVTAVTDIFRKYAGKDEIMLQLVLHSFVRVVGIYPSGSVVYLRNGQMAYIVDSDGPICVPFTDRHGNPVQKEQEPLDFASIGEENVGITIDRRRLPLPPKNTYDLLPEYLKGL